jgi:hypothetical protein
MQSPPDDGAVLDRIDRRDDILLHEAIPFGAGGETYVQIVQRRIIASQAIKHSIVHFVMFESNHSFMCIL